MPRYQMSMGFELEDLPDSQKAKEFADCVVALLQDQPFIVVGIINGKMALRVPRNFTAGVSQMIPDDDLIYSD